jgi:hypothetical protein
MLFLATAFAVGSYLGRKVDRHLATAIAAADRDDPHWRIEELLAQREQVSVEENSALVVDQVVAMMPENWPLRRPPIASDADPRKVSLEEAFNWLDSMPDNFRLDDEIARTLEGELKSHEKAVHLARTLGDYRRGRRELVIGPAVVDTLFSHVRPARTAARLLAAEAAMRAHGGDIDGALDSCRAIFAIGRAFGDEPFLISQLVRVAIGESALKSMWRALGQGEASDAALARLQGLILDELGQPLLLVAVKGERAVLTEALRRVATGEAPLSALSDGGASAGGLGQSALAPLGRIWIDEQEAVLLDWMNEAVAIARRPAALRPALWAAWEANIQRTKESRYGRYTAMLPIVLAPGISTASSAIARYQTDLAANAILVAAERHRRKNGGWPTSIDVIDRGILTGAPGDPFAGAPFQMTYDEGQLRVYSVGPNGVDEHGSYDTGRFMRGESDDAGALVWDVSLRRQPVPKDVDAIELIEQVRRSFFPAIGQR